MTNKLVTVLGAALALSFYTAADARAEGHQGGGPGGQRGGPGAQGAGQGGQGAQSAGQRGGQSAQSAAQSAGAAQAPQGAGQGGQIAQGGSGFRGSGHRDGGHHDGGHHGFGHHHGHVCVGFFGNHFYTGYGGYRSPFYESEVYRAPSYTVESLETAVQLALAKRGYYLGPIDGIIGSGTRWAIRRFQYRSKLPVTGWIDGNLLKQLDLA